MEEEKIIGFGNSSKVLETFIKLLLSMASQIQHISVMSCQQNFFLKIWKWKKDFEYDDAELNFVQQRRHFG